MQRVVDATKIVPSWWAVFFSTLEVFQQEIVKPACSASVVQLVCGVLQSSGFNNQARSCSSVKMHNEKRWDENWTHSETSTVFVSWVRLCSVPTGRGEIRVELLYSGWAVVTVTYLLQFLMVEFALKCSSRRNHGKSFMWCCIAWFQIVAPSILKQSWLVSFLLSMHEWVDVWVRDSLRLFSMFLFLLFKAMASSVLVFSCKFRATYGSGSLSLAASAY